MSMRAAVIAKPEVSLGNAFPVNRALLIIIAALLVSVPMFMWGIPSNRNLLNHFRFALPFYDAMRAGHWYPGWLAESNSGYGDPSFRFYPPGSYYLLSAMRAATGTWYAGSLFAFLFLFIAGGIGMYLWAREVLTPTEAMWAGVIYSLAPYRLDQLYQAFFLAEFAGAAVLPFAFYFTERICRDSRRRDVAGLAASYAVLVLTHLPLTVIGSIALFAYAIVRLKLRGQWRTTLRLGAAVALGLAASACYWVTMMSELTWIWGDRINPDPNVDYRNNFVLSTFSSNYLNIWWMNILLAVTVAMFWPGLFALKRFLQKEAQSHRAIKATLVVLLLTIFMATPLSRPLWNQVRLLQQTQFPWRWLAITSLAFPPLLAAAIPYWKTIWAGKARSIALLAVGSLVIACAFSTSHIVREANYLNPFVFAQTLESIPGSPSISMWWPRWVKEPVKTMSMAVDAGARKVSVQSWQPQQRTFHVASGSETQARLRTFYYPHWKASADGAPLTLRPDADGAILVTLPQKESNIVLEFREPARTRVSALVTAFGWAAIVGLLLIGGDNPHQKHFRSRRLNGSGGKRFTTFV